MRRIRRAAAALAVAVAVFTASACSSSPAPPAPAAPASSASPESSADGTDDDPAGDPGGHPLALVYRGPAACDGCPEATRQLLEHDGYAVHYIGPQEHLHFGPGALDHAALYAQPGGTNGQEVGTAWRLLRQEPGFTPDLVRDYVRAGGRYLGLCMGGYLAGDPGYDLLPGDSGQYIRTPGATVTDDRDHLVAVAWRGRPQRMYFQDGPYFDVDGPGVDVLARYGNERAAAVVAPYGSGRVAVSGPHPEAPADWYRDYGLPDESATGQALGEDLLHALQAAR
ncbi:BPL-N domain-containing protein [Kitasatospora sp. NPDC048538]|uniref:BPL-N domain-containing protein n=1 Tax=unclassified Kitasatospora TaxID=2633591 RepID=UPI0033E9A911